LFFYKEKINNINRCNRRCEDP